MTVPTWLDKARQIMSALAVEAALAVEGKGSASEVDELIAKLDAQLSSHAGVPSARELNATIAKELENRDAFSSSYDAHRAEKWKTWAVGQIWAKGDARWRVERVFGDRAVLRSVHTEWAVTRALTMAEHQADGPWWLVEMDAPDPWAPAPRADSDVSPKSASVFPTPDPGEGLEF